MAKGNPFSPHDDFTIKSDKGQDFLGELKEIESFQKFIHR